MQPLSLTLKGFRGIRDGLGRDSLTLDLERLADGADASFKQCYAQLVFELLDRHRQGRLGDIAFLRRATKVAFARESDNVAEVG